MDLILHQKGIALNVANRLFRVADGITENVFHPSDLRSIRLGDSVHVTSAALLLAIEHGIDVTIEEYSGRPAGRIWSPAYGSIATIRKRQLEFIKEIEACAWVVDLILEKLNMQVALVSTFLCDENISSVEIDRTIRRMLRLKPALEKLKGQQLSTVEAQVRGLEGKVSAYYFKFLGATIPEPYQFQSRSRRPALDMFNCLLNYGYGILYGMIERDLIRVGLDPYCGILHKDRYNTPSLSFDVIERYRVWVDSVVVNLCRLGVIFEEFFEVDDSAHTLNHFGKKVFVTAFNDYFDEVIKYGGMERSRRNHIFLFCQGFASKLLKQKTSKS